MTCSSIKKISIGIRTTTPIIITIRIKIIILPTNLHDPRRSPGLQGLHKVQVPFLPVSDGGDESGGNDGGGREKSHMTHMKTRPGYFCAKDCLGSMRCIHSGIPGEINPVVRVYTLDTSTKQWSGQDLIIWTHQSTALFQCIQPFSAWWWTNEQPTGWS